VVLEVIKPCLHKLARLRMFGCMLAELAGFARALRRSLEDDGVRFDAYPRLQGNSAMVVFVNDRPVPVVAEEAEEAEEDGDDDGDDDEEDDEDDDDEDDDEHHPMPQRICGVSVLHGLYDNEDEA
jgi:hypothetical protein